MWDVLLGFRITVNVSDSNAWLNFISLFCILNRRPFVMKIIGNTCDCFKQTKIMSCSDCNTDMFRIGYLHSSPSTQVGCRISILQYFYLVSPLRRRRLIKLRTRCKKYNKLIEQWFSLVLKFYWWRRSKVWSNKYFPTILAIYLLWTGSINGLRAVACCPCGHTIITFLTVNKFHTKNTNFSSLKREIGDIC